MVKDVSLKRKEVIPRPSPDELQRLIEKLTELQEKIKMFYKERNTSPIQSLK